MDKPKPKGLSLTRELGETIIIGGLANVTVKSINGKYVTLLIDAPREIHIDRSDTYKEHILEKQLLRDLDMSPTMHNLSEARLRRHDVVKRGYGKYSGRTLNEVPTYFLEYVLKQEFDMVDRNDNHINTIINELEKRKHGVNTNGQGKSTTH